MGDKLIVRGAREHNLRDVDVELPRDKMIVFTGLSGSGKSSLAFDTIYAEGQRRYVESLSAYARQFLGQMDKPDVDFLEGLSPAISIDQKSASRNPRSTVGTITEVYDYLRLLFARIGIQHDPETGAMKLDVPIGTESLALQDLQPTDGDVEVFASSVAIQPVTFFRSSRDGCRAFFGGMSPRERSSRAFSWSPQPW